MKRILLITFGAMCLVLPLKAQHIFSESFYFPARDSLGKSGGWEKQSYNNPYKIKIVSQGLAFKNYTTLYSGNSVLLTNEPNGNLCYQYFPKRDTQSVYLSYLINVDSLSPTATWGYNVSLDEHGGVTNMSLKCNVKRISDTTFTFGVEKTSGTSFINAVYSIKTTYLVVMKYSFVSGSSNDSAKIYIFSNAVPELEPANPDTFRVDGVDANDVGQINISNSYAQNGLNGSRIYIDEIRIGTSWKSTIFETASDNDYMFSSITPNQIASATLSENTSFNAGYDSSATLYPGTLLFYKTESGRFGKMRILGNDTKGKLSLRFTTYENEDEIFSQVDSLVLLTPSMVDLDSAMQSSNRESADIEWTVESSSKMTLASRKGTSIEFSDPLFANISLSTIQTTPLLGTAIAANNDSTNLLPEGAILFYKTNQGNYGKLKVLHYGSTLTIKFFTVAKNGALVAFSDSLSIPGTWLCDLDSSSMTGQTAGADFKWSLETITLRKLLPKNNALFGFQVITDVRELDEQIPYNFSLAQNFPNPFNPTTTIHYQIATGGNVSLKIYDVLGKEITTLVNEFQNVGNYSIQLDASKLASGIYFYVLHSGSFMDVKKMILLR